MADTDENISLKEKYESLKILCSEQVLANELLKDEMEKLRKKHQEVSRHRAFLLEKLLQMQSKTAQNTASETKRPVKSSVNQNSQSRNAQRARAPPSKLRAPISRPKTYPRDVMVYEESDPESDNGDDFENDWDDDDDDFNHMPGPSYRRIPPQPAVQKLPKPIKRPHPPPVKMPPQVRPSHPPAFKQPRLIDSEPGPSPRGNYGNTNNNNVNSYPHAQSQQGHNNVSRSHLSFTYPTDNGSDFGEEPPVIYSKSSSTTVSTFPTRESGVVARRPPPNILRPASSALSGGNVSDRFFSSPRVPTVTSNNNNNTTGTPGSAGYYGSRMH